MDFITKNRLTLITIILLVLLNIATLTFLWITRPPERKPYEDFPKPPALPMLLERELGLNQKQLSQFEDLRKKHFQETHNLLDTIHHIKRAILNEVKYSSSTDDLKVKLLLKEIGKYQEMFEYKVFEHFKELKSLCNDEQKTKFNELIDDLIIRKIPPPEPRDMKPQINKER